MEENAATKRYYSGYQGGGKKNHGELWGARNLLQYKAGGFTPVSPSHTSHSLRERYDALALGRHLHLCIVGGSCAPSDVRFATRMVQ